MSGKAKVVVMGTLIGKITGFFLKAGEQVIIRRIGKERAGDIDLLPNFPKIEDRTLVIPSACGVPLKCEKRDGDLILTNVDRNNSSSDIELWVINWHSAWC